MDQQKTQQTSDSIAEDFIRFILNGCREIAANRLLVLLALVIGMVYMGIQVVNQPGQRKGYELKMAFIYTELHHKIYGDLVQGLQHVLQSGDKAALAATLHLPANVVDNIDGFRAYNINGLPLHEDAGFTKAPFYVYVDLKTKNDGSLVHRQLENYLNQNEFVERNKPARDSELVMKLGGLDKYINLTDGILQQYASGTAFTRQSALDSLTEKDVTSLVSLGNALTKERIETEKKLTHAKAVESMYGIMYAHPAPPKAGSKQLLKWFLQGTGIGIILMFLTGFFMPLFRKKH